MSYRYLLEIIKIPMISKEGIVMQVNHVTNTNQTIQVNKKTSNSNAVGDTSFEYCLNEASQTVTLNDLFEEAAREYGVPVNLLKAIGMTESSFRVDVVSKAGAQGVMQLMPATAKELGVTNPFDARQNIMGGAKYISQMLNKYDGDVKLALAAYNAGSGNVAKYGGIPPFEETQNYVVKVMNYMKQDLDASKPVTVGNAVQTESSIRYNLNIPKEEEVIITTDDVINELYSYEDYMKFLEYFFKKEKSQEQDTQENAYEQLSITNNMRSFLTGIN